MLYQQARPAPVFVVLLQTAAPAVRRRCGLARMRSGRAVAGIPTGMTVAALGRLRLTQGPVQAIFMAPARQQKVAIEARGAVHASAWARRATTSAAFCCLARRVAPQRQRLRRCKSSPGVQPGCGLRLASTAFAGQRAP